MKRILLVDNSQEVHNEVEKVLSSRFRVIVSATLAEARRVLDGGGVDLVLLDTKFPDGEGFGFCADLKVKSSTASIPVIFLTSNSSATDKVKAFSVGADDYLVKPFDPLELEIRVEVRLRKTAGIEAEQILQVGQLILNVPYQKALLKEGGGEKDIRLTPTEFRLLYFFIKNEGLVLSRDQLLSTVWSSEVHVLSRTIDKHISTLKKKLHTCSGYIQSVHSRGYRFSTRSVLTDVCPEISSAMMIT